MDNTISVILTMLHVNQIYIKKISRRLTKVTSSDFKIYMIGSGISLSSSNEK